MFEWNFVSISDELIGSPPEFADNRSSYATSSPLCMQPLITPVMRPKRVVSGRVSNFPNDVSSGRRGHCR